MRDSALKLRGLNDLLQPARYGRRRAHARQRFETLLASAFSNLCFKVGEELMRDSALKPGVRPGVWSHTPYVGEELMRDSALKLHGTVSVNTELSHRRRRAHARQRFETRECAATPLPRSARRRRAHARQRFETLLPFVKRFPVHSSEKSSCATAL